MQKLIQLLLLVSMQPVLVVAQTPKRIHDLKSLTDSSGTVHLFYRIYAEYEGTEYSTNNIYHYNTKTGEEELFLMDFYDTRYGFPYSVDIIDYKFLNNDPLNYVFITTYCDNECSSYVGRKDSSEGMGGLFVTIENLNVEGSDSGRVYVKAFGEVIIGRNGGRDWPEADAENFEEIPDSSKLGFPLTSLSPYDDSLMFGRKYFNPDGENAFLMSINNGLTTELISDTLLPDIIEYDSDYNTVYIVDKVNAPGYTCTSETCKYGIYTNSKKGERGHWEQKELFDNDINLSPHPTQVGRFYVWDADSVLVTKNYGENFEILLNPKEEITGFSVGHDKEYYTTTSALFSYENGNSLELLSIPVSNEYQTEIPTQNKLLQNYPNPFNPSTNIQFELPFTSTVSLIVYDVLGREVATLVNGNFPAGKHTIRFDASTLANGIYLYKLRVDNQEIVRKMTLIK